VRLYVTSLSFACYLVARFVVGPASIGRKGRRRSHPDAQSRRWLSFGPSRTGVRSRFLRPVPSRWILLMSFHVAAQSTGGWPAQLNAETCGIIRLGPSQVTNSCIESGDRRIDESGDRQAGIVGPQTWREGHLTIGQVPDVQFGSEERRPTHNMWS
jgi:hypothetical protein